MKCPNGLNKTIIVTFPRSGHHLLVRGLLSALPDKIVYSEFYKSAHNGENCDFVNLQKTHDFGLETPIRDDIHYIVQIRGFELAVESWYKVVQNEGYEGDFDTFRESKSEYFDQFMAKWVNSNIPNRLVISYHDLVNDKVGTALKALHHIGLETIEPHQLEALRQWEAGALIKNRKHEAFNSNRNHYVAVDRV